MRTEKYCPKCERVFLGAELIKASFYRNSSKGDGLDWRCKGCARIGEDIVRKKHREKNRYQKDRNKVLTRTMTRKIYGRAADYKCSVISCSEKGDHFHHVSYDGPHHVVALCQSHHKMTHELTGP